MCDFCFVDHFLRLDADDDVLVVIFLATLILDAIVKIYLIVRMSVLFIEFFNTPDFACENGARSALYQNRIQFFYPYRLNSGNGSWKSSALIRACSNILKSLREIIVIRLSLHRDRTQNLHISMRVGLRLDNVRVDVHLMESAAYRRRKFALDFLSLFDHRFVRKAEKSRDIAVKRDVSVSGFWRSRVPVT